MANPVQAPTGSTGAGQSVTVNFNGGFVAPTVGNWLVVVAYLYKAAASGAANPTISDTGSNAYGTHDVLKEAVANGTGGVVVIWKAKVTSNAGSPFAVTVDVNDGSGTSDAVNVVCYEVSGMAAVQPDVAGTSNTGTGATLTPGSLTPNTANDFAVVVMSVDATGVVSWTSPANYTSSLKSTNGANNEVGEILYRNLSGMPATNPSFGSINPTGDNEAVAQDVYAPLGGSTANNGDADQLGNTQSLARPVAAGQI